MSVFLALQGDLCVTGTPFCTEHTCLRGGLGRASSPRSTTSRSEQQSMIISVIFCRLRKPYARRRMSLSFYIFVRRHMARRMPQASSSLKALTITRLRQGRTRHMLGRTRPPLYAPGLDRSERSSTLPHPPSKQESLTSIRARARWRGSTPPSGPDFTHNSARRLVFLPAGCHVEPGFAALLGLNTDKNATN